MTPSTTPDETPHGMDPEVAAEIGPRRLLLVPFVVAGLSMLGPFAVDTPFPSFAELQREFHVDAAVTQQIVSVYLLAFGAMSIFHGPLSDALGRRRVMTWSLGLFTAATMVCVFAPSIPVLLVGRVLQGLAAGGGVIVSRTVIRDLYVGPEAQRQMSRVMMMFGLAPAVAPVLGGLLLQWGNWRIIYVFLAVIAVVQIAAVVLVLPETHPPERRTPLRVGALLRGLVAVFRSSTFQWVSWAGTFLFAGYFLYIGSAAIVVVDLLGGDETSFWWLFLPMICGMVTGSAIAGRTAGTLSPRRLITLSFGVSIAAALVNIAIAAVATAMPWPIVGPALLGLGVGIGYPALQLAVLDLFPHSRGAAASMTTFLNLMLNAIVAGAFAPIFTSSLLTMALGSLGFIVLGALCWTVARRRSG